MVFFIIFTWRLNAFLVCPCYSLVPLLVVMALQDCHCSQPILGRADNSRSRALDRYLGGGICCVFFTLFRKILATPLGMLSLWKTLSIILRPSLTVFLVLTHAVAAKHVVLILVLEASARAQSVRFAPADSFLLMPDVQPLVHHLGHADGRGVRELGLGETNCFEIYAVCVTFPPLMFVLQIIDMSLSYIVS